jgi:hypothetical protein
MTRPVRSSLSLIAVIVALLVAACGGGPVASPLTDPTEILQAAATQAASATSVHLDVTADGGFEVATGPATTTLSLEGSTASADLDLAGGDARVTFALPGILDLRGELLVVDGTAYAKTSMTGPRYVALPIGGGDSSGAVPSPGAASFVTALTDVLATPGLEPVKGVDAPCGGTTCYTVEIELTADELASLGLGDAAGGLDLPIPNGLPIPIPDLSTIAGVTLTAHVEQDTQRLAGLTIAAQAADAVTANVELHFSKWDESVSIEAPPADQVGLGG